MSQGPCSFFWFFFGLWWYPAPYGRQSSNLSLWNLKPWQDLGVRVGSNWLWVQFATFRAQPSYITASGAHMEFGWFSNLKFWLIVLAEKHSKRSKKLFLPLSAAKSINWSSVCSEAGLPRAKWLPSSQKQRLPSSVPAQVRISQQCMSIRIHSWSWSRVIWQSWACPQERTLKTTGENPAGHAWGILAMPAAMSPCTVLDSKWSFECPLVSGKTFYT